jgi:hypothetical protein
VKPGTAFKIRKKDLNNVSSERASVESGVMKFVRTVGSKLSWPVLSTGHVIYVAS